MDTDGAAAADKSKGDKPAAGAASGSPAAAAGDKAAGDKAAGDKAAAGAAGEPARLHVGHLTRNVSEAHVREIFSTYGPLKGVELAVDRVVNLPRCGACCG